MRQIQTCEKNQSENDKLFGIFYENYPSLFFEASGTRPKTLWVRSRAIESNLHSIALHLRVNISDARRCGIEQGVTHVADPAAKENCKRVIPRFEFQSFSLRLICVGLSEVLDAAG